MCPHPLLLDRGEGWGEEMNSTQSNMNRTTHRSSASMKLYAVRDKTGKFKDIQTYKRAHGQDIKRKSKAEKKART